ncbi:MAG: hypothetical protein AB8F95_01030 [Bacteroidia bacterium]
MKDQEQHSELEAIYQDEAWKDELRNIAVKKAIRKLWRVALVLVIALFLLSWVTSIDIPALMLCLFIMFLVCGMSALFLGMIPYRDYSFTERVDFLAPLLSVLCEVFMIGLVLIFLY